MRNSSVVRGYLLNSSFHGLHFLVEDDLHWSEKVFWFLCVLGSWSCSVYLMVTALNASYDNPVTLTVDSNYLHWETHFPAIIVCESKNLKTLIEARKIFADDPDHFGKKYNNFEQMVFFRGFMTEYIVYNYAGNMSYYRTLRSTCAEIFEKCLWNGKVFNCCDQFYTIETVFGPCFAANSIHTNKTKATFSMKMHKKPAILSIDFKSPDLYIFGVSNEEIPTYTTATLIKAVVNYEYNIYLGLQVTVTDSEVREIDIPRRKCRFSDENNLEVAKLYSFESCKLQCQKKVHISHYNCTHHFMPYAKPKEICDEKQIVVLAKDDSIWTLEDGHHQKCACELACNINDVKPLAIIKTGGIGTGGVRTVIRCDPIHIKYLRQRAKHTLDNIVYLGGTASLCVGASILSVIEVIYFFTIRALDTKLVYRRKLKQAKQITVFPFVK